MTQEEKRLLLRDLSARLPYWVKVKVTLPWANDAEFASDIKIRTLNACLLDVVLDNDNPVVKPYLRSMSSMTDGEKAIYSNYQIMVRRIGLTFEYNIDYITEWLLQHHLDFRGLIEKGLAIEAPEGMYNFK